MSDSKFTGGSKMRGRTKASGAPDYGLRLLRVGEIMERGDFMPGGMGTLIPINDPKIGNRVLGIMAGLGADEIYRPRKRPMRSKQPLK